MIYRKTIEPRCSLCKNASFIQNSLNINCKIYGQRPNDFVCKKYDYDIFKRQIKPKPKMKIFKSKDFDLNI